MKITEKEAIEILLGAIKDLQKQNNRIINDGSLQ